MDWASLQSAPSLPLPPSSPLGQPLTDCQKRWSCTLGDLLMGWLCFWGPGGSEEAPCFNLQNSSWIIYLRLWLVGFSSTDRIGVPSSLSCAFSPLVVSHKVYWGKEPRLMFEETRTSILALTLCNHMTLSKKHVFFLPGAFSETRKQQCHLAL